MTKMIYVTPTALRREPRYLTGMIAAVGTPRPGTAYHVDILHDDWCDLITDRGECNCNPEIGAVRTEDTHNG